MFALIINQVFTILHKHLIWKPDSPQHFAPLFSSSLKSRTVTTINLLSAKESSSKTMLKDKSLAEVMGRFLSLVHGISILTELN